MLIYNHDKQMIGVDEETLRQIGYSSMTAFLKEHSDVADLFVKKPGYVHKFQNFSWIDFVRHADAEETKAIIANGSKHFSCLLSIAPFFLSDAPEQEGFAVTFKHLRSLNDETVQESNFETEPVPIVEEADLSNMELPTPSLESTEQTILEEPDLFDIPDLPDISIPDVNPDGSLNIPLEIEEPSQPEAAKTKPMLGDYINAEEKAYIDNLKTGDSYTYDPHIAADELGLPVELISEFIGDFIQQAHEFKSPLFDAALKEDFDEVHLLSHKLKGVAANLRVEDAFEVLSNVNTSHDQIEIEANLKQFYRIIARMEGKEAPELPEIETPVQSEENQPAPFAEDDDIYDLGFTLEEPSKSVTLEEEILEELPIPSEETTAAEFPAEDLTEQPSPDAVEMNTSPQEALSAVENLEPETAAELTKSAPEEQLEYDPQKAALELDLKAEFVTELAHEFKQSALGDKEALLTAIQSGDSRQVQSIAFEFKGLSDNLRIKQISDSLQRLLAFTSVETGTEEANRLYTLLEQL